MSQYTKKNKLGREVLFGSDKPTGGFFITEFYRDDELTEDSLSDVVVSKSALTIREILSDLIDEGICLSKEETLNLLNDWLGSPNPTPLQYNVSLMFGKDLAEMILRTDKDVYSFVN